MNHFQIGVPARGDNFYGRRDEIRTALGRQWTWICAQRRVGKTSLLWRIQEAAERQGHLSLFLDLEMLTTEEASPSGLLDLLVGSLDDALWAEAGLDADSLLALGPSRAFRDFVRRFTSQGRKVTFIWDEAERLIDVARREPSFLESLRAQLQDLEGFRFVIAGTQLLSKLYDEEGSCSPFISSFEWLPLGGLSDEDAFALLRCEQTGGWMKEPGEEALEPIVRWCGGHAWVLQKMGSRLAGPDFDGSKITPARVERAFRATRADESLSRVLRNDYTRLSAPQQKVLRYLCEKVGGGASLEEIGEKCGLSRPQVNRATSFLYSYGYVDWSDEVELRFQFYSDLIPDEDPDSSTEELKLARLRKGIFFSYSHEDNVYRAEIRKFLIPLLRSRPFIICWDDTEIAPGDEWEREIQRALSDAGVVVLVVSPDFLRSDYIWNTELPMIFVGHLSGNCKVGCVYVRHCGADEAVLELDGRSLRLTELQGLNKPDQPLSSLDEGDRDRELVKIANAILKLAEEAARPFARPAERSVPDAIPVVN